jgi:hypothetical protein
MGCDDTLSARPVGFIEDYVEGDPGCSKLAKSSRGFGETAAGPRPLPNFCKARFIDRDNPHRAVAFEGPRLDSLPAVENEIAENTKNRRAQDTAKHDDRKHCDDRKEVGPVPAQMLLSRRGVRFRQIATDPRPVLGPAPAPLRTNGELLRDHRGWSPQTPKLLLSQSRRKTCYG